MWRRTIILIFLFTIGSSFAVDIPNGYLVPPSTYSPDQHYGVTVPIRSEEQNLGDAKNSLIDLKTGHLIATIESKFTGWSNQNRGGVLPSRWSPSGSLLLWEVEGRFSPDALTLLCIENDHVKWQRNLLELAQQAILIRTRKAAPERYAAAKKWHNGGGGVYPDGFTVNVRAEGDKERGGPQEDVKGTPVTLPLKVHAELTSNPKWLDFLPKEAQLDSELDGLVDQKGQLTVSHFRLRDRPFPKATATSWLELTNPSAVANASAEYGDVVTLKGKITTRQDKAGNAAYILILSQKISVPASFGDPAEDNVLEIHLLGFDRFGGVDKIKDASVSGTLGHAQTTDQLPVVTLKVHGAGWVPSSGQ